MYAQLRRARNRQMFIFLLVCLGMITLLARNVVRDDVYVEPLQFTLDHPDTTQIDLAALITSLHEVLPKVSLSRLQEAFASDQLTARIAVGIDPSQSDQLRKLHLPDVFLGPR